MPAAIQTINDSLKFSVGFTQDNSLRIRIASTVDAMRARFMEFVLENPDLNVEQDPSGEIVIMTPAGAQGSSKNSEIAFQLTGWTRQHGGWSFDSSAMFVLANGAKRSPDAAWIQAERWEAVPASERELFPTIAPDFVIELRSKTDRLAPLKQKMQEYVDNGVRLGWLIDPQAKQVLVYRLGAKEIILENPIAVSGEEVLTGFVLDTSRLF